MVGWATGRQFSAADGKVDEIELVAVDMIVAILIVDELGPAVHERLHNYRQLHQ